MSRFTNLATTTNEFEENESDDMCVSDEDKSSLLSDDSFDAYEILGTPLFNGSRNRLAKKRR